jgi:hypothetical protein
MQIRWLIALVPLAACRPGSQPTITAHVTAVAVPLEDVTVAAACPKAEGGAARTDSDGIAQLVVFFDRAARCTVTASLPGFDPQQLPDVPVCAPDATCDPIEIALVQVIP